MKFTPDSIQDTVSTFFLLNEQLEKKPFLLEEISDFIPDFLHLPDEEEFLIAYSYPYFLEELGITFSKIVQSGERVYDKDFEKTQRNFLESKIRDFSQGAKKNAVFAGFQLLEGINHHRHEWIFTLSTKMNEHDYFSSISEISQDIFILEKKLNRIVEEELFAKENAARLNKLTKREMQIFKLMAQGNTSEEIGEQLHIAKNTVSVHRKAIRKKLDIKHNFELGLYARAFELF